MINLILFLLCSLGVSYAWSDTDATKPLRNFIARFPHIRKPLLCHECSSFWISLLLSFFFCPIVELPIVNNILLAFCGFFVNLYFSRNHLIPFNNA